MKKKIYIVLPIFNEENIIEKVVNDLLKDTSKFDPVILLINDGSSDNTKQKIKKFEGQRNIVIINKDNEGHGQTILHGYNYALKEKCDYIFQLDSDDQFFTEDIEKILNLKSDEDLIIGRRIKRKDQLIRLIITQIMKSIIFIRHGVIIKDSNSPFRLIKSEFLLKNISKINDSIIPNVLLSIIAAKNKKLKFIDVEHKERQTGEVSIKKWKLFVFCLKSFKEIIQFK